MSYVIDPRIAAAAHPVARLELCEAWLQDDARFVWILLVPQRAALVDIVDLHPVDQRQLWRETRMAGKAVHAVGTALGRPPLKLNHGQLGNAVSQLHVHVVGRHPGDAAWPGPVWGFDGAEPYGDDALAQALAAARAALG